MIVFDSKPPACIKRGLFILFFVLFCFSGCSASDAYFKGLDFLEKGNVPKAKSSFSSAIKSSNSVEAYLALKSVYDLCTSSEKLSFSKKVYDGLSSSKTVFKNDVAVLYALALLENAQYPKAEKIAQSLLNLEDLTFEQRSCFLYCKAVSSLEMSVKHKIYDFSQDDVDYFLRKTAYSEYHDMFLERYETSDFPQKTMLQFRQCVVQKNYTKAAEIFFSNSIFDGASSSELSDIGKFLLFSSSAAEKTGNKIDYEYYAKLFENTALEIRGNTEIHGNTENRENTESRGNTPFYLYFYSARFYDKINIEEKAVQNFLLAAKNSFSDSTYDNALWYYFSTLNSISESRFLSEFEKYGDTIKSKSYYSDLFEQLFVNMLSSRRWTAFCNLNPLVEKYADGKTQGMYNYIFARLLQEDFVDRKKFSSFDENALFEKVVKNPASSNYYILISSERLGMSAEDALKNLFSEHEFSSPDEKTTKDLQEFMNYAIKHKKIALAYSVYRSFRNYLSSDYLVSVAYRVNELAKNDESLYPLVLRFASAAIYSSGGGKTLDLLSLYSPQFFKDIVSKNSEKYGLQEDLMYGLIHTESFFDKDIVSHAGAVGLCQLMPSTASDVAKKLKMQNYDLTEPETNIEFGSFYFAEMIRRLDGSVMSAIVSYNSGITRVRNWHKKYPNVPIDIFVEMLPIAESRGYGKKVLSAAAIYGYLYYDKSTQDIISQLLR